MVTPYYKDITNTSTHLRAEKKRVASVAVQVLTYGAAANKS